MRHYNLDVYEAERHYALSAGDELDTEEEDDRPENGSCRSFFDMRQRALVGLDQMSAFKVVVQGVRRKLGERNARGSVLYSELEDALNRYCRLLEADMQRFASLHETLQEAADKQHQPVATPATPGAGAALAASRALLAEGMREIAVVLLACGEMQRRALDLKMTAQLSIRSIAEAEEDVPPLVSFSKFGDFLEEALAVSNQLRRKHEDLHQQRMRAMTIAVEVATARGGSVGSASSASPRRRAGAGGERHTPRSGSAIADAALSVANMSGNSAPAA